MKVGIIQGRLSTPTEGFQECPKNWRREFDLLDNMNLNDVEWIITKKSFSTNPIFFESALDYPIHSICADNLVDSGIHDKKYLKRNLIPICTAALRNNIRCITIPLLEESDMSDDNQRHAFGKVMQSMSENFPTIGFLFEAELEADKLLEILELSNNFYVTYDTGNITSCGYNHEEYIAKIGKYIRNVHLKDRTHEAQTVFPTSGDTDFKMIFKYLKSHGYNGVYTLQTARGKSGNEINTILLHKDIFERIYYEQ